MSSPASCPVPPNASEPAPHASPDPLEPPPLPAEFLVDAPARAPSDFALRTPTISDLREPNRRWQVLGGAALFFATAQGAARLSGWCTALPLVAMAFLAGVLGMKAVSRGFATAFAALVVWWMIEGAIAAMSGS